MIFTSYTSNVNVLKIVTTTLKIGINNLKTNSMTKGQSEPEI